MSVNLLYIGLMTGPVSVTAVVLYHAVKSKREKENAEKRQKAIPVIAKPRK